jgi:hypothetical protein
MLVARHQPELELDARIIGNLLQQVHGIANVAIVTLRILFGLIEHQEGFALQEMSRYFRVWYDLTGEAQNRGISPVQYLMSFVVHSPGRNTLVSAILGTFAKLGKAIISSVLSVCPSVRMEQLCNHCTDSHEI